MAHTRASRPGFGLGFRSKSLQRFKFFPVRPGAVSRLAALSSDTMYEFNQLNGFRKSTALQNRQLIVQSTYTEQ
jgi:hypothetical protein